MSLAAVIVGAGVASSSWRDLSTAADLFEPTARATWTVEGGQTLWDIAQTAFPAEDPREVVMHIRHLNQLPSSGVEAGQILLLPDDAAAPRP